MDSSSPSFGMKKQKPPPSISKPRTESSANSKRHVAPNIWLCCKSCWQLNSMSSQYLPSVLDPQFGLYLLVFGEIRLTRNSYEKLHVQEIRRGAQERCLVDGETPCWPNNFRKGHWNMLCVDWASIGWLQAFICITGLLYSLEKKHGSPKWKCSHTLPETINEDDPFLFGEASGPIFGRVFPARR